MRGNSLDAICLGLLQEGSYNVNQMLKQNGQLSWPLDAFCSE